MDLVSYSPVDKFLHHKWNCLGNWRTIYTTWLLSGTNYKFRHYPCPWHDSSDSLLSTEHIPQWMVAHHITICYISTLLECHWITSQIYPVCPIRPWINCCDHILLWTTKFSMILGIGWNDSIGQYLSAYWICCRLCLFFLVVWGVWQIIIVLNFWQVSANLHWCISYWKVLLWLDQPKQ